MASVKVKFRPSSIDGKEGCIYYQVIHNRAVHLIIDKTYDIKERKTHVGYNICYYIHFPWILESRLNSTE